MESFTNTIPFFHTNYVGTSVERLAITTPKVLDNFIETDTGETYTFGGSVWGKTAQNGVPIVITA